MGVVVLGGCTDARRDGLWGLHWMERPDHHGPASTAPSEDRVQLVQYAVYDHRRDRDRFAETTGALREGDLVAYWMDAWEARGRLLTGQLGKIGYGLFRYGHIALVVRDPTDHSRLCLLSSEHPKGPNTSERLPDLREYNWDAYRLDQSHRIDLARLRECADFCSRKSDRSQSYSFSEMFGLKRPRLRPTEPDQLSHDSICSTLVLAALYYSGVALDAVQGNGRYDVCTPGQVVASRGVIIPLPQLARRPDGPGATATQVGSAPESAIVEPGRSGPSHPVE